MVEIQDPVIKDRQEEFIADEISFLNFVVSDYDKPIVKENAEQASIDYDEETKNEKQNLRSKLFKAKNTGDYIKEKIGQYEQERKDNRDEFIKKRTLELDEEINEGLRKLTRLSKLIDTISDARTIQDNMILVFGVDPKNITLLAT